MSRSPLVGQRRVRLLTKATKPLEGSDVILGCQANIKQHPGTALYRNSVKAHSEGLFRSKDLSKLNWGDIDMKERQGAISNVIEDMKGHIFVKKLEGDDCCQFEQVTDKQVHEKVVQAFKDRRKDIVKKAHRNQHQQADERMDPNNDHENDARGIPPHKVSSDESSEASSFARMADEVLYDSDSFEDMTSGFSTASTMDETLPLLPMVNGSQDQFDSRDFSPVPMERHDGSPLPVIDINVSPEIYRSRNDNATLYTCSVCNNFKWLSFESSFEQWTVGSKICVRIPDLENDLEQVCPACSGSISHAVNNSAFGNNHGSPSSGFSNGTDFENNHGPHGGNSFGHTPGNNQGGPGGGFSSRGHGTSGHTRCNSSAIDSATAKETGAHKEETKSFDLLARDLHQSKSTNGHSIFRGARGKLQAPDLDLHSKRKTGSVPTQISDTEDAGQLLSIRSDHKLIARNRQLSLMEASYVRVTSKDNEVSELVRIHGSSGCGKSALMKAFMNSIKGGNHFYLEAKFDQLRRQTPYAALTRISQQLCNQVLGRDNKEEILERMRDKLGPDYNGLLGKLMPALTTAATPPQQDNKTTTTTVAQEPAGGIQTQVNTNDSLALKARFKLLFRDLLRSASSSCQPLIVFLDDLQWIDEPSLEVLMSLTRDKQSKHMMIVLAYRDDETSGTALEKYNVFDDGTDIEEERISRTVSIFKEVDVPLVNLDLTSLNALVVSAMGAEDVNLSTLVYEKTHGNPFYALSFLDQLVSSQLLVKEEDGLHWDRDQILKAANVSSTLTTLLIDKVQRLPDHVRSTLQIASCLGFDFSVEVLVDVIYEEQNMADTPHRLQRHSKDAIRERTIQALLVAVKQGLLEDAPCDNHCKFFHDKIQLAIYEGLMPEEEERKCLHHRIGMSLWKSELIDDDTVFLIADSLNRAMGVVDYSPFRYDLVELNMRASEIALDRAAFLTAAEFLRSALNLLEGNLSWSLRYDLCVKLHMSSARVEVLVGNCEGARRMIERLLDNVRSEEDRMAAKIMGVNIKLAESDIKGSLEDGFEILRQAGTTSLPQRVPFTKSDVVKELVGVKMALGFKSVDKLAELKPITSVKKQLTVKLMVILGNAVFFEGEEYKNTFAGICARMTKFTIRNGVAGGEACVAFAACGMVYTIMGWYDKAMKMEKLALRLLNKLEPNSSKGWTYCLCKSFIFPWRNRLTPDIRDGFLHTYRLSRLEGDSAHVHLSFYAWMVSGLYLDTPLSELTQRTRSLVGEAEEVHEHVGSTLMPIIVLWQLILNLHKDEKNANPTRLQGEAMDAERTEKMEKDSLPIVLSIQERCKLDLAFLYEDWDFIAESSLPYYKENSAAGSTTHFAGAFGQVMHALALYEIAFRKDRSVWKEARNAHRVVEKWATGGALFLTGAYKLLNAMRAMCHPRQLVSLEKIEELFAVADRDLSKHHCVLLQAIANERLAQYCRDVKADSKYHKYMTRSIELYDKMEAWAKVDWLKDRLVPSRAP